MRTAPGLLLLASSLLLACGSTDAGAKSCTTIGCVDGLSVGLSQPFTTPGSYLVTVQTESGTTTCQTKLPFDGCQSGSPCSSPDVLLEQSGCALPADQHSIVGLRILKGFPSQVTITVARDGAEVLSSGAKAIGYQTSQPNGPDCEPVCKQASLTLTVDKP